jgi:hypothetical protein
MRFAYRRTPVWLSLDMMEEHAFCVSQQGFTPIIPLGWCYQPQLDVDLFTCTLHRYPNCSHDHSATPCQAGCIYDIFADPTEHARCSCLNMSLHSRMFLDDHTPAGVETSIIDSVTQPLSLSVD